ncbi:hypothetical protein [Streptomyces sp. ODS28]|uniref:hypothetical protein n=1 Tax=Streptomyces sp. ODS28 TaxID=3136688 RepID=UPI0031EAD799
MPHLSHRAAALAAGAALAASAVPAATARAADGGDGGDHHVAGKRRVAVAMVDFTDSRLSAPEKFRKTLESRYFGKSGSLDAYYGAVSRGTARFVPADQGNTVTGPLRLPMSVKGCDTAKMEKLTKEQLAERGVGEDDYDHLSIVFPAKDAGCGWAGLAGVQGGTSWMPDDMSLDGLVHEIGHNLGFSHHMRLDCPASGKLEGCRETGDTSGKTPMGGGGAAAGPASPEMAHVGWFGKGQRVRASGSGTYALRPLHGGGNGTRAVEVPLTGGDSLMLELRAANPDKGLDKKVKGVFAYRVKDGDYTKSTLVDTGSGGSGDSSGTLGALRSGDAVTSGGTRVSVASVRDGSASVRVSGAAAAQSAGSESAGAEGAHPQGGRARLAETGGGSSRDGSVPLTAGGAVLLAAGAGSLAYGARRRRARGAHRG